jgi:hypothetical protein
LQVENRETHDFVIINQKNGIFIIESNKNEIKEKTEDLLRHRCFDEKIKDDGALKRANCVVDSFEHPSLEIFNHNDFCGAWKWIGLRCSSDNEGPRFLMLSAISKNKKGVHGVADWAKNGEFTDTHANTFRKLIEYLSKDENGEKIFIDINEELNFEEWQKELKEYYDKFIKLHGCEHDELMKL